MSYIFNNRTFKTLEEASMYFRVPVSMLKAKWEHLQQRQNEPDEEEVKPSSCYKGVTYEQWGFSYDDEEDVVEFGEQFELHLNDEEYIDLTANAESLEMPLGGRRIAPKLNLLEEDHLPKAGKWIKHNQ